MGKRLAPLLPQLISRLAVNSHHPIHTFTTTTGLPKMRLAAAFASLALFTTALALVVTPMDDNDNDLAARQPGAVDAATKLEAKDNTRLEAMDNVDPSSASGGRGGFGGRGGRGGVRGGGRGGFGGDRGGRGGRGGGRGGFGGDRGRGGARGGAAGR